jgi:hypothetical protein
MKGCCGPRGHCSGEVRFEAYTRILQGVAGRTDSVDVIRILPKRCPRREAELPAARASAPSNAASLPSAARATGVSSDSGLPSEGHGDLSGRPASGALRWVGA